MSIPIATPSDSVTPAETRSSEPASIAWTRSSTAARDARATSGTDRLAPSSALRTSRAAAWTISTVLDSSPFAPRGRVDAMRVAVVSVVMSSSPPGCAAGAAAVTGLQLYGRLPVGVEEPAMTRFKSTAAAAAAE